MEKIAVYNFIEDKKDFLFPNDKYTSQMIENALLEAPDDFEMLAESLPFRKPGTVQLLSIFPGQLGVDRFYLGEIGKGILKYFSFGGIGIWWIADMISAKKRCRAYNCKKLMDALNDPAVIAQMQDSDAKLKQAGQAVKTGFKIGKTLVQGMSDVRDTFEVH